MIKLIYNTKIIIKKLVKFYYDLFDALCSVVKNTLKYNFLIFLHK